MNKFTTLSTRNYLPLSYQDQYFYNKYDLIRTFLEDNFGEDFSELLAFPILKRYEVDWLARTENRLKRVSEFSKSEQDKILNIYWEKINKINVLTTSFLNSNSSEKKEWANLLNDVFNSESFLISMSDNMKKDCNIIKEFLYQNVYNHPNIYKKKKEAKKIIVKLFDYFINNFNALPTDWLLLEKKQIKHRIICDYISGMTDRYASKLFKSIYD